MKRVYLLTWTNGEGTAVQDAYGSARKAAWRAHELGARGFNAIHRESLLEGFIKTAKLPDGGSVRIAPMVIR